MLDSRRLKSVLPTTASFFSQGWSWMHVRKYWLHKKLLWSPREAIKRFRAGREIRRERKWLLSTSSCNLLIVYRSLGNTLRRNRRHLMKEPEASSSLESEEEWFEGLIYIYIFFRFCTNSDINCCSALSLFVPCAVLFISMGRCHVW